jgi:hypothetical protein
VRYSGTEVTEAIVAAVQGMQYAHAVEQRQLQAEVF